jgi:hypothetical protein
VPSGTAGKPDGNVGHSGLYAFMLVMNGAEPRLADIKGT